MIEYDWAVRAPGNRPLPDRRVHASSDQMEVVRYERSGKWWLEPVNSNTRRRCVSLAEAAEYTFERMPATGIRRGVPGGLAFDRALDRLTKAAP